MNFGCSQDEADLEHFKYLLEMAESGDSEKYDRRADDFKHVLNEFLCKHGYKECN